MNSTQQFQELMIFEALLKKYFKKQLQDVLLIQKIKYCGHVIKKTTTEKRDSTHILVLSDNKEVVGKVLEIFSLGGNCYVAFKAICAFGSNFYGKIQKSNLDRQEILIERIENILDSILVIQNDDLEYSYYVSLNDRKDTDPNCEDVLDGDFDLHLHHYSKHDMISLIDDPELYK